MASICHAPVASLQGLVATDAATVALLAALSGADALGSSGDMSVWHLGGLGVDMVGSLGRDNSLLSSGDVFLVRSASGAMIC